MIWHQTIETLLEELCDEAQVRNKLHGSHYIWYQSRNARYTLPVIILSVLSGSGNFISVNFPIIEKWLIIGIGGVSIMTSIISAVAQYLKLGQFSESHRVATLAWGKFYTSIKFQLLLKPEDRTDPKDLLQGICSEYERLYEISPILLPRFIKKLSKKLHKLVSRRFKIPYYMNGFAHVNTFNSDDEFDNNTESDFKQDP